MSELTIRHVTVRYGDDEALSEVSLEVAPGETVAIIGPSGSGKSTLLRAVAGLEPLAAGSIELDGADLAPTPTHRRDLGLMFQDHALFGHLDVADNVGFGPKMHGWDRARRRARVDEVLVMVGLDGFGSRAIASLSGGEAQRVALARALAPSPGLLMLDEPLGSLDRVLREQLTVDLRRLFTELGVTALHVTHDQVEAFALADRVAVLQLGRVEQIGTPAELWAAPGSVFVARFVGHPNVWAGDNGWIVVPVSAVTADRAGEVEVVAEIVQFREGRYRVTGRRADRPEPVVFDASEPTAVGDRLRVAIDHRRVVAVA